MFVVSLISSILPPPYSTLLLPSASLFPYSYSGGPCAQILHMHNNFFLYLLPLHRGPFLEEPPPPVLYLGLLPHLFSQLPPSEQALLSPAEAVVASSATPMVMAGSVVVLAFLPQLLFSSIFLLPSCSPSNFYPMPLLSCTNSL